ncbi:MAG TPA: hypothetical protein VJ397_08795 [Thermoplasmata archaeon]|nr:hypothetical protein [Thermoplasmata archaeon]
MSGDRVRAFLGVWAPLLVAGFLAAVAVSFLLTAPPTSDEGWPGRRFPPGWEATWYLCGVGLFGVAALLVLSTLGRYRKARLTAQEERGK